jgi:lipopolysaccharide export LptBFGC system permease protein LptF
MKKVIVGDIKRGKKSDKTIKGHLFRNREEHRTWFVARMSLRGERMQGVQIIQQDADGNILEQWYAREAVFDPLVARWILVGGKYVEMDREGNILKSEMPGNIAIEGWSETPWRISSSMLNADFLSVPELNDYLNYNADFPENRLAAYRTHWHYRWAMPVVCFLVIFVAAPCGIVYSRRGVLGGVALAIGMFFSLVFFSSLFIALGKGGRVSPFTAAWGPMIAFFIVGLALLWMKSTNREMPKFKIPGLS